MTAKFYGVERSFLHDTTEDDACVIDMVRASEYVKIESEVAALQEQLSNYSMSAGQADQRKSESDTVRVALGFSTDADDVAPCDLVDAIAALQEQVRELAFRSNGMTDEDKQQIVEEYNAAMCASNEAGYAGITAAETIRYLIQRAEAAEAEIARRDAAASEVVHLYREHNPCNGMKTDWIEIDSEQLASLKESTDPDNSEFRTLQDAASPAVLPPLKKITSSTPTDWHRGVVHGWNSCIETALLLGALPQKPVVLPEPHAHLIWIQAGRGPDDYFDDFEVSRSEDDRCCDGSERYAVYSEFEVKSMLDAANIPYEVKL